MLKMNISGGEFSFSVVVGATPAGGIGNNGILPWPRLAGDMKWFKEITTKTHYPNMQNAVVMGRRTWESIPKKFRPLPGRLNIVLSTTDPVQLGLPVEVQVYKNFQDALAYCEKKKQDIEHVFVIGGGNLFNLALRHPACKTIYYTKVKQHFPCDTFIDHIPESFQVRTTFEHAHHVDNGVSYTFKIYDRVARAPAPDEYVDLFNKS